MSATFVIAIDGPAASGKSSVSKALASQLSCACVNSGALYRAVTWGLLQRGIDPADPDAIATAVGAMDIHVEIDGTGLHLLMDGQDPAASLRDSTVAAAVSPVAGVPAVRDVLTARLREMGQGRNLIMEGRDIGTVVFPDTPWKFYIDASEEIRIQRRMAQGESDSIRSRDRQDSQRAAAPLKAAGDAVVIDSTHLSQDEVIARVLENLRSRKFPGLQDH